MREKTLYLLEPVINRTRFLLRAVELCAGEGVVRLNLRLVAEVLVMDKGGGGVSGRRKSGLIFKSARKVNTCCTSGAGSAAVLR